MRSIVIHLWILIHLMVSIIVWTIIVRCILTIVILIDICIVNVVVIVICRNASIFWMSVPLSILSLEAIITVKRIEFVPSIIFSHILVPTFIIPIDIPAIIWVGIIFVRTSVVSLKVFILSLWQPQTSQLTFHLWHGLFHLTKFKNKAIVYFCRNCCLLLKEINFWGFIPWIC